MLATKPEGLQVGADDFVVAFAAPVEALFDEFFQVFVGHIHEVGQRPHYDHVARAVVSGGAGQFFDGEAEGPVVPLQLELGRVEDNHAVFPHVCGVTVVSLLVEGDENVDIITRGQDGVDGNPGLSPGRPAQNL